MLIQTVDCELEKLKTTIQHYNANVNESGIWLFIATLGCWSLSDIFVLMVGVICTFIIFTHKLIAGLSGFSLFTTELNKKEEEFLDLTSNKVKQDAIKYRVIEFKKSNLGYKRLIYSVPAYYVAIVFFSFSLLFWVRSYT